MRQQEKLQEQVEELTELLAWIFRGKTQYNAYLMQRYLWGNPLLCEDPSHHWIKSR